MNTTTSVQYFYGRIKEYQILNVEWLQKYFRIEDRDEVNFLIPKVKLLLWGFIFYAQYNDQIVILFLLKVSESVYEVSKMAVTTRCTRFNRQTTARTLFCSCQGKKLAHLFCIRIEAWHQQYICIINMDL
jgi:hypothetical protein